MPLLATSLLFLISSLFSVFCSYSRSYPTHPYKVDSVEYYVKDGVTYQRLRPHSAPATNELVYPPPNHLQMVPVDCVSVLVPVINVGRNYPCYYPRTLVTRSLDQYPYPSISNRPQEISQNHANEEYLKRAIFDSIGDIIYLKPTRTDINLRSFIYNLKDNQISRSLSAGIHLNWFIEFCCSCYNKDNHDNLVDYFDYIKEYHLIPEIDQDPLLMPSIDTAVMELVHRRCILPEIIAQLLEMAGKCMSPQRADNHYNVLLRSIVNNEGFLSKNALYRYLNTIESFLQFIPHIPFHIILIKFDEPRVGLLRIALHFAYFYQMLLGFKSYTAHDISSGIIRMCYYSNGSVIEDYYIERFKVLNLMLKQTFARIMRAKSKEMVELFNRFNEVAKIFFKSFQESHLNLFIRQHMDHLLDFYLFCSASHTTAGGYINFIEYVVTSYYSLVSDKYFSMYQIAIYLSNYSVSLTNFRENYKKALLIRGIDEDFILVLETIIAATEKVVCGTVYYETWEPSIEFLILQFQISSRDKTFDKETLYPIIDSPFLMLAAKIYLSRQTGFPISFFATSPVFNDAFSWSDALNFVNFYFEQVFIGTAKLFKVKSQFFEDLGRQFNGVPTFDEMIYLYQYNGPYENIKREIKDFD